MGEEVPKENIQGKKVEGGWKINGELKDLCSPFIVPINIQLDIVGTVKGQRLKNSIGGKKRDGRDYGGRKK